MPAKQPTHSVAIVEGMSALYEKAVTVAPDDGGASLDDLLNDADGTAALEKAVRATISVAAACHLTFGGATPTATEGHPIAAGATFVLEGNSQINAAKLISDSGSIAGFVTLEG